MSPTTEKRTSFLIGALLSILDRQEFGYKDISEFRECGGFANDTEARIAFYKLCDLFLENGACQQPTATSMSERSVILHTSNSVPQATVQQHAGATVQQDAEATVQHDTEGIIQYDAQATLQLDTQATDAIVNDSRRNSFTLGLAADVVASTSNNESGESKAAGTSKRGGRRRYSSTPPWAKYSLHNPRRPFFLVSSPESGSSSQSPEANLTIRKRLANDESPSSAAKRPRLE